MLRERGDLQGRKYFAEVSLLRKGFTGPLVPMIRMSDVKPETVDWLWYPYIPFGKLTILQGNPGEGKTYLAMHLAAACTNRLALPSMDVLDPLNVIYQTV